MVFEWRESLEMLASYLLESHPTAPKASIITDEMTFDPSEFELIYEYSKWLA
jgi:hypothetical protein